jgi:hypothetical protein
MSFASSVTSHSRKALAVGKRKVSCPSVLEGRA